MNGLTILRTKKLFYILSSIKLSKVLFKFRVAAATEHIQVIKTCKFDILFDVGSNRGQFALIAKSLKPEIQIFCFEPQVEAFKILNRIFANQEGFNSFNKGLGSVECRREIFVAKSDDSSSYLQPSQKQILLSKSSLISDKIETEITVLDQFIHFIDPKDAVFVKIDVQGFEYEVLLGGHDFFQHVYYIYCECSFIELYLGQKLFSDISYHLNQYGFIVKDILNKTYNSLGELVQADILFQRNKS
jgi:FkbM family methyltransferase